MDSVAGGTPSAARASTRRIRVHELAKVHGVESKNVLMLAKELGFFVKSASSQLTEDAQVQLEERLAASATPGQNLDRARQLVIAAFREAKLKGREDWDEMRISVLKNRLLNVTGRAFEESDYNARSFQHFVALLPDLLDVDTSTDPWTARLVNAEAHVPEVVSAETPEIHHDRVRPDLWKAVVDFRSAEPYVWDSIDGVARTASNRAGEIPLPTISRDTLRDWRRGFITAANYETVPEVVEWFQHGYGTKFLPPHLQGEWNGYLRDAVVARIEAFFETHGLPLPPDVLVDSEGVERWREQRTSDGQTEELRRLIMRCVAMMTYAELSQLQLNAATVARALGTQNS